MYPNQLMMYSQDNGYRGAITVLAFSEEDARRSIVLTFWAESIKTGEDDFPQYNPYGGLECRTLRPGEVISFHGDL